MKLKKILIVDDADFMREMIEDMLDPKHYKVVGHAFNGKEAVAKYKQLTKNGLKPNIVLMDLVLPEKDGLLATKEILDYDKEAKILIVSALNAPEIIKGALEVGAKGYIHKPITIIKLLSALTDVL
ncbi:MAG: response regulator, partial [Methanosarcinales archaeon]